MFQIAICDDKIFCEYFRECLEAVIKKMDIECNISIWYSGALLQEHLINKNRVDLIFLDIVLVEGSGVSIGKFIRENLLDYQVQIVYISNEPGYAMQLFETEPMDFLVKPIEKEQIEKLLQRFLRKKTSREKVFAFKEERGDARIPYDSIWYFQSMNHKVVIHTIDGQREFYGKLTDVESMVPDYFVRIHKSYLVNENFISRFHYDMVIMRNEQKLPISKPYRNAVQERIRHRMKED